MSSDNPLFDDPEDEPFLDPDFVADVPNAIHLAAAADLVLPASEDEDEAEDEDDFDVETQSNNDDPASQEDPEDSDDPADIMPEAMKAAEINTISVFSGEKGPDAERFMDAVDRAKNAFQWSQADTARAAQQRMTGVASQWIKYNARLGVLFEAWSEAANNEKCLRDAMEKRFITGRTLAASIGGLAELQQAQKSMESTSEFVERLSAALDRKNYDVSDTDKQAAAYRTSFTAELVKYLLHGLRDDLKSRVIGVPNAPTELSVILDICTKAEEEHISKQHIAAISQETKPEPPTQTKEVNAVASGKSRSTDPDRFKKFPCNVCKKLGHWANTCSQKPKRQPNPRGNNNGNNSRPRGRGGWRGGRGGGQQGGSRPNQLRPQHNT